VRICRAVPHAPASFLPDLPFRRYRLRPQTVRAVLLRESEAVPNPFATGEGYRGEAGTWKVFYGNRPDGSADVAIVVPQVFRETYEPVAGDQYRKKTTKVVAAAQLKAPLDIVTLEGPAHGEPGDWLLIGVQGHPYLNDNAYFREHYVLAE
jgi:hypothetical protein